jgi:hypothetical protein
MEQSIGKKKIAAFCASHDAYTFGRMTSSPIRASLVEARSAQYDRDAAYDDAPQSMALSSSAIDFIRGISGGTSRGIII